MVFLCKFQTIEKQANIKKKKSDTSFIIQHENYDRNISFLSMRPIKQM
jgi:hypothetical protein